MMVVTHTCSPTPSDHDAFPDPKWPQQSIYALIGVTFGRIAR